MKNKFYFTVFSFQSSKHILKGLLNCIQIINIHSNRILVRFESYLHLGNDITSTFTPHRRQMLFCLLLHCSVVAIWQTGRR